MSKIEGNVEEQGAANYELSASTRVRLIREQVVRKIVRVSCVVGVLSMIGASFFLSTQALIFNMFWLLFTFSTTLLPPSWRVTSIGYPWALTLSGLGLALLRGPTVATFVVVSGGLFIASLVAGLRHLAVLVVTALVIGLVISSIAPEFREIQSAELMWLSGAVTIVTVVIPSGIAGHMIQNALHAALRTAESESARRALIVRDLEETQAQLTHAQKLEILGQLAGGIAHDMNNTLTAIMGEASLLEDSSAEERERILQASDHAAQLTRQLMVLGRRDMAQVRSIDLAEWISRATSSIRRMLPSEIQVHVKIPDRQVPVLADPMRILQVLLNLASNARDALTGGGRLSISLAIVADIAVLSVEDDGTGIDEATLTHIFEPFFTTKPRGAGTGLGLSNVKQLIEEIGGSVKVSSTMSVGTKFTIQLPLTDQPVESAIVEKDKSVRRNGTILVIDDDVRVRAVVYTALERVGFRVLEAHGPAAARALWDSNPCPIDLMLTDVVMPEGGGREAMQWMAKVQPRARFLVMSGYNADETLRRGIAHGDVAFLAKPFTADQLVAAVDAVLATDTPIAKNIA